MLDKIVVPPRENPLIKIGPWFIVDIFLDSVYGRRKVTVTHNAFDRNTVSRFGCPHSTAFPFGAGEMGADVTLAAIPLN